MNLSESTVLSCYKNMCNDIEEYGSRVNQSIFHLLRFDSYHIALFQNHCYLKCIVLTCYYMLYPYIVKEWYRIVLRFIEFT